MELNNKLLLINNNHSNTYTLNSNDELNLVYLIYSSEDINVNVNFITKSNSNISINVVVINNNKNNINCSFNMQLLNDNNDAKIKILSYGLNESKTSLTSNFDVVENSNNNVVLQKITGILISNKAKITGEPNLKINSLNVNAKHSLNIGSINKDEIFYLKTKGFDELESKKIISNSYLNSLINNLKEQDQKKVINFVNESLSKYAN